MQCKAHTLYLIILAEGQYVRDVLDYWIKLHLQYFHPSCATIAAIHVYEVLFA